MQYLIQDFCRNAKLRFTGDDPNFKSTIDLEDSAPALKQYMSDEKKDFMEDKEWIIELDFNTMKSMFDPIVNRILEMIEIQLNNNSEGCSAIFLVGGFSQSKYLQKAIKNKFSQQVENITIPTKPIAAVVHGAAIYGKNLSSAEDLTDLNKSKRIILTRRLCNTYGVLISPSWTYGDPPERMTFDGRIHKFYCIVKRGTESETDQEFKVDRLFPVYPFQTKIKFELYYTKKYSAEFCDEPDVKTLGKFCIELPDTHLGTFRPVTLVLAFGNMEIKATAFNETNGQNYQTTFELKEDL
jgi:hypothetical protein